MRRVLVLALLSALSGCASAAPQPSAAVSSSAAAPSVAVDPSLATVNPRFLPRAYCFETQGVWRTAAGNCDSQAE